MSQTRFTPDLDLDGLSPDEAFAILGNDIRLEIIRVLWRADAARDYDDGADTASTMLYSDLQRSVDVDDNGKFNYHISRLTPHFVRSTDDGYRLSGAGKQIARTVIAVSGADGHDFSTELDDDCPLCGGPVEATYEDQWLRVRCTRCEGLFGDQAPTGTLFLTNYPAAGLSARDPEDALATGLYRCALDITYMLYGICRECAGPVSGSVSICESHDGADDHPCAACGTPFPVWADMRCDICGFAKRLPVEMFATGLAMASGLTDTQALDVHTPSFDAAIDVLQHRIRTDVSTDPVRIDLTIALETSKVTVVLDEEMTVLEFDRTPRSPAGTA